MVIDDLRRGVSAPEIIRAGDESREIRAVTMGRTYRWARRPDRTACGDPEVPGARPLVRAGAPPGGGSGCPPQDPHAAGPSMGLPAGSWAGSSGGSPPPPPVLLDDEPPRREHPQMTDDLRGIHAAVVGEAFRGAGRA
jgi:hypothetical protein